MESISFTITPNCKPCHDFKVSEEGPTEIRTAWLTPVTIRKNLDDYRLSWRCNYGEVCCSKCLYAHGLEEIGNKR